MHVLFRLHGTGDAHHAHANVMMKQLMQKQACGSSRAGRACEENGVHAEVNLGMAIFCSAGSSVIVLQLSGSLKECPKQSVPFARWDCPSGS